ncbi:MAG: hypothetical protein JSV45_02020 [Chromatiales bacterium]|nr:MAG: hypothetical protein JSV45_02020 [Chromatiales bacterium]
MKFVRPHLGVLAAICCWASATHAAGMPAVDTDGVSPAAAREVRATKASVGEPVSANVAFAGIADQRANSLDGNLQTLALLPRAKAFGVGPQLGALAAAWNDALAANHAALPGLHSIQTAEVRRQFVNAPEVYGLFNVEEACLAVGCMTEFALSPQTPEGELLVESNVLELVSQTTVVPVPPALLLFGSALGLLGWIRRRLA